MLSIWAVILSLWLTVLLMLGVGVGRVAREFQTRPAHQAWTKGGNFIHRDKFLG